MKVAKTLLPLFLCAACASGGPSPGDLAGDGTDRPDAAQEPGPSDLAADAPDGTGPDAPDAADTPDVAPPEAPVQAGTGLAAIDPVFEPYTDTNGNRVWDKGEPFEDRNGNQVLDTLWIGGFGPRQPTGTHDPLTARALALRLHGETYVLCALDTLGFGMGRVVAVKEGVKAALGAGVVDPERILVASTHTHQAPDTVGLFAPDNIQGWDEAYLQHVVDGAVTAITDAVRDLRPAHLRIAHADGTGLARDIRPPEVLDPYVGILQAVDADGGAVIATLAAIANHPEAAWGDNTLISADFPHYLRQKIEADLGGRALYFSADEGLMQTPSEVAPVGFERAQAIGEGYAERIAAALQGAETLDDDAVKPTFGYAETTVPLQNFGIAMAVGADLVDGYRRYVYFEDEDPCRDMGCMDLPHPVLRLGDRLTLMCVPAEVTPELVVGGITAPTEYPSHYPDAPDEPVVKDHLATPDRLFLGLCGSDVGYLYPKVTTNMDAVFDQQNGPGPDCAGIFLKGLTALLDEVNARAAEGRSLPRLHAEGTRIVDSEGREVALRGVNLGGWMFHETWITLVGQTSHGALYEAAVAAGVGGEALAAMRAVGPAYGGQRANVQVCPANGDEWVQKLKPELESRIGGEKSAALLDGLALHPPLCDDADLALRKVLSGRFGDDGRDALLDAFQGAWLAESDIAWLATQGFNVVRVPIGYRSLVTGPDVDAPESLSYNPKAEKRLLDLLDWCRAHGVYAVVDIQEAPGGQNTYSGTSGLYADPRMQDLTVQLWEHLSDLLKDRDEVAAYSLLAEPYGAPDAAARDAMYDRLVKAIRAKGDDHLCVIHDGFMGMATLPKAADLGWTNVVYSTHLFEWTTTDYDGYVFLTDVVYGPQYDAAQAVQGVPYYIGSFSTILDEDWAYDAAGLMAGWMNQHGWSWSLWTYKRPDDPLSRMIFDFSSSWGLLGRLAGAFTRPDPYTDDYDTLKARFEAYRYLRVDPNETLLERLKHPGPRDEGR